MDRSAELDSLARRLHVQTVNAPFAAKSLQRASHCSLKLLLKVCCWVINAVAAELTLRDYHQLSMLCKQSSLEHGTPCQPANMQDGCLTATS